MKSQENTGEFTISLSLDVGIVTLDNASIDEFYFIEDIFSYCICGKTIFTDKRGVFEFGPLTGNETINISYGEEDDKEWSFYIYKLSRVDQNTDTEIGKTQSIEIFFVDKMFYSLNFLQFSKSWSNKKISDIVIDISEKMLGISQWDKLEYSKETMDLFYMPYWNSSKTINFLLKRATGVKSNQPGFVFYNNSLGSNMVTLDTLLQQKKLLNIGDNDDGIYVFSDINTVLYNKILGWSISGIDSISLKSISGNTIYGYNSLEKSILKKELEYSDVVKKHTILGQKTLFPDYSEKRIGYENIEENSLTTMENIYKSNWNKKYDHQQVLTITVRGHERRYCGSLIEIGWPSNDSMNQKYNKNLSGYYLIKSIVHYFSGYKKPHYTQKMLCIKNGYEDSDSKVLVKSTKKNIAR